jgi:hypothetical protein
MSNTSIGRGPASGGNENHDGDPLNTTMGETVQQEAPAGNELIDEAAPDEPPGVEGAMPNPGMVKGTQSSPGGPKVEASPWQLDASHGKLPKP